MRSQKQIQHKFQFQSHNYIIKVKEESNESKGAEDGGGSLRAWKITFIMNEFYLLNYSTKIAKIFIFLFTIFIFSHPRRLPLLGGWQILKIPFTMLLISTHPTLPIFYIFPHFSRFVFHNDAKS